MVVRAKKFYIFILAGALAFGSGKSSADEFMPGIIRIPQTIEPCTGPGNQSGLHRQYFDDGTLFMETRCAGGPKHGASVQYYPDGSLLREESWLNGQLESLKTYHPNGPISSEEQYKNGKLDGRQRRYLANGQMYFEQEYRNGRPVGPAKSYDQNGNTAQVETFNAESLEAEYLLKSADALIPGKTFRQTGRAKSETAGLYSYEPYLDTLPLKEEVLTLNPQPAVKSPRRSAVPNEVVPTSQKAQATVPVVQIKNDSQQCQLSRFDKYEPLILLLSFILGSIFILCVCVNQWKDV